MSNPLRGEASFLAGDVTYTIKMDINCLCEAEDILDMGIDEILVRYSKTTNLNIVRALIWAGLQGTKPCSLEDAGAIISEAGFLTAKAALEKAIANAMPEAAADENPRKPGRAGTGSSSSKRGQKPASTRKRSGGKPPAY